MKNVSRSTPPAASGRGSRSYLWLGAGLVILLLVVVLIRKPWDRTAQPGTQAGSGTAAESDGSRGVTAGADGDRDVSRLLRSRSGSGNAESPAVVVAEKASAFARSRRQVVEEMARRFQVQVSPEVARFFDAAESGRWDEIKGLYNTLTAERESGRGGRDLDVLWPALKDSYSVAAIAASWPPEELLNYGESILASLRPGMVYVAGSEAARAIPALMGETSNGERPVILPQTGLGEGSQVDYLGVLHGDRMSMLSRDDLQSTFSAYVQEAQQRALPGDAQGGDVRSPAPGEAGLFKPGQSFTTGPNQVGGLNEKLLAALMERNPGMSFALEQGVPMESLYKDALPLGPILELKSGSANEAAIAARANESLDYWRTTAQRLQADTSLAPDAPARAAHAQMATTQAEYFAAHQLSNEAEQAFRLAREIAPASIDVVGQYSRYLLNSGRKAEALQLLEDYGQQNTDQSYMVDQLQKSIATPAEPAPDASQAPPSQDAAP